MNWKTIVPPALVSLTTKLFKILTKLFTSSCIRDEFLSLSADARSLTNCVIENNGSCIFGISPNVSARKAIVMLMLSNICAFRFFTIAFWKVWDNLYRILTFFRAFCSIFGFKSPTTLRFNFHDLVDKGLAYMPYTTHTTTIIMNFIFHKPNQLQLVFDLIVRLILHIDKILMDSSVRPRYIHFFLFFQFDVKSDRIVFW